jgi:glycopeptide antibiotics resistance protein
MLYSVVTVSIMMLGLLSRQFSDELPFIRNYIGDVLWAMMVFFGLALMVNKQPTNVITILAGLVSFGIETSQLYHAPWIDSLRATRLGGLMLGFSFVWSDLLCYSLGILISSVLDRLINSY